jgi:hypothetical protein
MAADPAVARGEAEAALAAGAPERAVAILAAALGYPAILDPAALAASLGVLARAMVALGHTAIAEHAAQASLTPGDADAYYQLGYELIEVELTGLAATVLTRGLVLAPGEPAMVTELVSALERELAYADARAVLEAHPELIERDCLCGYLTAWNAIMSGDVAAAEARVPRLIPTEPAHHVMIARLRGMLARAAVVRSGGGLGPRDLRGWHYVTTGGLLLERSPYGLDQPMHGRYAYLNDAPALVARGLDGLVGVLARWGLAPPCVFAAPGPGHAAIAAAAAARLGVAVAPWPTVGAARTRPACRAACSRHRWGRRRRSTPRRTARPAPARRPTRRPARRTRGAAPRDRSRCRAGSPTARGSRRRARRSRPRSATAAACARRRRPPARPSPRARPRSAPRRRRRRAGSARSSR